jgi:hypothetical protein
VRLCSLIDGHNYSTKIFQVDNLSKFMYVSIYMYIYCVYILYTHLYKIEYCTRLLHGGLLICHKSVCRNDFDNPILDSVHKLPPLSLQTVPIRSNTVQYSYYIVVTLAVITCAAVTLYNRQTLCQSNSAVSTFCSCRSI